MSDSLRGVGFSRELFCAERGKLVWREVEEEELGTSKIRLAFRYGSPKHGTERMLYHGECFARGDYDPSLQLFRTNGFNDGFRAYVTGNLAVCEVVEVGPSVSDLKIGEYVLCRTGFRERHVIDVAALNRVDVRKVPPGLAWQSALCLDPTVFALSALRDGHVRIGDTVAIVGLGALGLVAVQLAKAMHARTIVAVDPLAERRKVASELGADVTIDPAEVDAGEVVRACNAGRGMDVVIEMSGYPDGLQAAIRAAHYGGKVVLAGTSPRYGSAIDLGGDSHFNCLDFVFSRACSEPNRDHPRWNTLRLYDESWHLICSGVVSGTRIVNRIVEFDTLGDSYEMILDHKRAIKLGVQRGAADTE